MKKLAFITSVLMGIAPFAQAQPYGGDRYDHHDDDDRRVDEGNREGRAAYHYDAVPGMVPLAAIDVGRKETVDIGPGAGRFRALRLRALRGGAYVDFVEVRYGNGEQQHFDVHQRIVYGQAQDLQIGPEPRHIQAITVHAGPPGRMAQLQIVGVR